MRKTQARQAIVDLLSKSDRPVPARDIVLGVARARPDINKSTVYRFIKSLLESQQLISIPLPGRGALYELRREGEHYHFSCERCQEVLCLDNTKLELGRLVPRGYTVTPQNLVLSGICPKCS
jgi:Fur family ferric uptake transcriptional regulator